MLITKTSISITKTSQPLTSDTTLLIKLSCQVLEARRIIFFVNELWGGRGGSGCVSRRASTIPATLIRQSGEPGRRAYQQKRPGGGGWFKMEEESEDSV